MKYFRYWLFVVLIGIATLEKAHAQNVILDWNASASPDVSGYNVYYGTNSGNYPYKITAGNVLSATVSNLIPGLTYYFAATAYDAYGDESGYSPEISYLVPGLMTINSGGGAGGAATLQFPVAPGHWYEVQATTDLQTWTSIWQSDVMATNYWMQFVDPNAASFRSRFYRLVLH
jgi:hypothetical protein